MSILDWYTTQVRGTPSPKLSTLFQLLAHPLGIASPEFNRLVFSGVPEECRGLRSLIWKVLLKYLPTNEREWIDALDRQRADYERFKTEFVDNCRFDQEEDPLSNPKNQKWNDFYRGQKLWEDIEKDVRRTRPEMHFFFMPSTTAETQRNHRAMSTYNEAYGDEAEDNKYTRDVIKNDTIEKHFDVLARILFIYARLNPGIGYVQGMNEVLAPIYYCMAQDEHPVFTDYLEADTFFWFTALMSEIRDGFQSSLDKSDSGVIGQMKVIDQMLKFHDYKLWVHFQSENVDHTFYAMKWALLLMTQNFQMPDLQRLWDSLLSDEYRFKHLYYFITAILIKQKEQLLESDFGEIMILLQQTEKLDIYELLSIADQLVARDRRKMRYF